MGPPSHPRRLERIRSIPATQWQENRATETWPPHRLLHQSKGSSQEEKQAKAHWAADTEPIVSQSQLANRVLATWALNVATKNLQRCLSQVMSLLWWTNSCEALRHVSIWGVLNGKAWEFSLAFLLFALTRISYSQSYVLPYAKAFLQRRPVSTLHKHKAVPLTPLAA